MPFLFIHISQGSVATHLRRGGMFKHEFVANLLLSPLVKKIWKSDNSWWSYGQEFGVLFFLTHGVVYASAAVCCRNSVCLGYPREPSRRIVERSLFEVATAAAERRAPAFRYDAHFSSYTPPRWIGGGVSGRTSVSVCLRVCLSVCERISGTTRPVFKFFMPAVNFLTFYLRPWIVPSLAALLYVIYFLFCGQCHVCT